MYKIYVLTTLTTFLTTSMSKLNLSANLPKIVHIWPEMYIFICLLELISKRTDLSSLSWNKYGTNLST